MAKDERTAIISGITAQIDALSRRRLRAQMPPSPRRLVRHRRARHMRVRMEILNAVGMILGLTVILAFFVFGFYLLSIYANVTSGVQRVPLAMVCFALFGGGVLTGWIVRDNRK